MFTALDPPSPVLDLAYSDIFSNASRSDSGNNEAESGLPHAGYHHHGNAGDMGGGVEAGMNHAEGVLVSQTDLPLPSPSPTYNYYHTHLPYVSQSQHEQAYHLSSTSVHSQVESRSSLIGPTSANLPINPGTTLGAYPELYSQFLPHASTSSGYHLPASTPIPSSTADIDIAPTPFPPSPSRVYSTSKALHAAVSHPLMRTQSHSDTAYARPHPYARLPHSASFSSNTHTISRSASTASLRHISGTSTGSTYSTLSMPPPPPCQYRTQPQRSISNLSAYSSSSLPHFGVSVGSSSEYSLSQPASRSTSGSGSDGDHYLLDTPTTSFLQVQQGTSRYFPPSTTPEGFGSHGAASQADAAVWMVNPKSAYLPQGGEADSAINVGAEHLYMSGLGPISGSGPDEETRRIEDEATWRIIKGNGIMGGGDSDDDDEEEEADEEEYESVGGGGGDGVDGEMMGRYSDDQAISPGTSEIGDETEHVDPGADSDTEVDIPLASRTQPIPPPTQPTATSPPLPCPPTLPLIPSQDPPKPKKKPSQAWSGSKRRSRAGRSAVGVEVFTLPKGGNEFVERRREEALRLGLSFGLEVEAEAEAEEWDDVGVEEKEVQGSPTALEVPVDIEDGISTPIAIAIPIHTQLPIPLPAPVPAMETSNSGIILARSGLRYRHYVPKPLPALIPSPLPSIPNLPSASIPEVEYYPSGRPKRSTVFTIKKEYPTPHGDVGSTVKVEDEEAEEEDDDEGDEGEDERDNYSDTGDRDSREATPLWSLGRSQTRSRKFGSPFVVRRGNGSGVGVVRRHHADPEVRAKVESLRKRLLDPKLRTGNFDEKFCQLLVDPRFSDLTGWSEDGEKIVIPDFEAFWKTASPYVMRTQTKRSAFDKQLSNHGFKRETSNDTGTKVRKTLHHPALSEGDTTLWNEVGKLEQLTKWGKGSKSSQSSNTTSRTTLRHLVVVRDSTIEELTERVQALQLGKDKSLGQFCALFPQLWTEENVMAIFSLGPSDIPAHLALPPPSYLAALPPTSPLLIKPDIPKIEVDNPASDSGTGTRKVVRKRSRQGDLVAEHAEVAKMEEGTGAEQTLEVVVEVEAEGEAAVERKTVSRKRSKLVLAKSGRK